MRTLRPLAVLAFAVAAIAAPARAQSADTTVQVAYDQDTDSTTVTLEVPFGAAQHKGRVFGGKGRPDFTWTVGFVGAGHGPIVASVVTSIFAFKDEMAATWYNAHVKQLGGMEQLELVLDGKALPPIALPPVIGSASTDDRSGRVTLERSYAALFSPEILRRIAGAAEAEGRLHGRAFVIDGTARESLRALVTHLATEDAAVAARAGR